jgi:hypothetical protein
MMTKLNRWLLCSLAGLMCTACLSAPRAVREEFAAWDGRSPNLYEPGPDEPEAPAEER